MSEKVVVAVNEGKIRGVKEVSKYSNVEYLAFYGIPYAEPFVKSSRFKDPVKVKPWKNIHDGTKEKPGCSQLSFLKGHLWGNEDCLFNNVYTQRLPRKDEPLRPVIVNIHGGAYHTGTPHTKQYGSPALVIHHDIVYICISYRLHILGFLNLGLKDCSGNQGIKDIIMSLHWIKDNVKSFGGDPENITLLGASSGASTIHLLMLSPAVEKNLFHKAVLMSGYLMNPIAPYQETNEIHAREMAKLLDYEGELDDRKKMLNFLKRKTPEQLINTLLQYEFGTPAPKKIAPITALGVFSPTVDPLVLPCSPQKLTESMMRIPIMIGFCERESAMGFTRGEIIEQTRNNFATTFCQNCWGWGHNLGSDDVEEINRQVELFYTGGTPVLEAPMSLQIDVQSDICISDVYDTLIDVVAAQQPSSVFVYKFEFEGKLKTMKELVSLDEQLPGTYHGSEYIHWNNFDWDNGYGLRDERTRRMVNTFTKLVTTFAKTGTPNYNDLGIRWEPSTVDNPCYLIIDEQMKMVKGRLSETRLKFWDEIKKQFKKSNDDSISF
ncbi:esterase E4-like [Planococcus citri]|uniref:esterase E4-like n=1 Tax=Planococcus citri TaxID=170843 RepID=UPI0031F9BC1E